jgi:hypothetical protein
MPVWGYRGLRGEKATLRKYDSTGHWHSSWVLHTWTPYVSLSRALEAIKSRKPLDAIVFLVREKDHGPRFFLEMSCPAHGLSVVARWES